jgi:alanine dehydrogenase
MPGAVGRTSTYALCNATLPYVLQLAAGVDAAIRSSPAVRSSVNVYRGRLVQRAVADAFGLRCEPLP